MSISVADLLRARCAICLQYFLVDSFFHDVSDRVHEGSTQPRGCPVVVEKFGQLVVSSGDDLFAKMGCPFPSPPSLLFLFWEPHPLNPTRRAVSFPGGSGETRPPNTLYGLFLAENLNHAFVSQNQRSTAYWNSELTHRTQIRKVLGVLVLPLWDTPLVKNLGCPDSVFFALLLVDLTVRVIVYVVKCTAKRQHVAWSVLHNV